MFSIYGEEKSFKRVSIVLGGTGLTPGYSLIARVCLTPDDGTELRVIDANKSENYILLKNDLDRFERESRGKLKIAHVLSQPSDEWRGIGDGSTRRFLRSISFRHRERRI